MMESESSREKNRNELMASFREICRKYNAVFLDTHVCVKGSDFSKKERKFIKKTLGIERHSTMYKADSSREGIKYVNEIMMLINEYSGIKTTDGVIGEMNKYLAYVGGMMSVLRSDKKDSLKQYKHAVTGLRNLLKQKVDEFSEKEQRYFRRLEKRLNFLKGEHDLSETDYELVVSSTKSACKESTAIVSNDKGILKAVLRIKHNPRILEGIRYSSLHKLTPYTCLNENHFYEYKM